MTQALAPKIGAPTVQSRSHRRLAAFVDWISPEPDTREAIRTQAADIRRVITGQATADGLVVSATPEAGSFAKHTGLRRHMRGHSDVEGQDVDLPFVIKPKDKDGDSIDELLRRFDRYAGNSYPRTLRDVTASSVELRFVASKLNYDLVPMLATGNADYQVILKKDGSRRATSVAQHTKSIRRRMRQSDERAGRVKFNECDRLFKWWRCVRIGTASTVEEGADDPYRPSVRERLRPARRGAHLYRDSLRSAPTSTPWPARPLFRSTPRPDGLDLTDRIARLALRRAWKGDQPFGVAALKAAIAEIEPSATISSRTGPRP
jgi:Second Messenger Oligonucleotide or Dinucleotide Synthetase domain